MIKCIEGLALRLPLPQLTEELSCEVLFQNM